MVSIPTLRRTYISFSEDCFGIYQTVYTLMRCRIKWHFILVFTVCQIAHLGVTGIKRFKYCAHCEDLVLNPDEMALNETSNKVLYYLLS